MKYNELLLTPEYWTTKIQIELYQKVEQYLKEKGITKTEFAKQIGVSKGYVTQILNGDYDHRLSKLVELSLAIGYRPQVVFSPMEEDVIRSHDCIESLIAKTREIFTPLGYLTMTVKTQSNGSNETSNINLSMLNEPKKIIA